MCWLKTRTLFPILLNAFFSYPWARSECYKIYFFWDLWNALRRREVAGDEDGITIVNS